MKVFVAVLLLALASGGSADVRVDPCANCEFVNGVGYVPGENCRVYHQCVKYSESFIGEVTKCCPERTRWSQRHLSCVFGYCDVTYDCPDDVGYTDRPCGLKSTDNPTQYIVLDTYDVMDCPVGNAFSQEDCACVYGENNATCDDDPLLYFPFATHFNDIQCHKVQGTPHGDAHLVLDKGYLWLDGKGDFVSFGFLENYFAWNWVKDITITLWFNQTQDGWDHVNNSPLEGLFGNGNCFEEASIWMAMGNETQQGGACTDKGEIVFENGGADQRDRWYIEPDVWCQMSIRCGRGKCDLFLNGILTATRYLTGHIKNTQATSTIGLVYRECLPYFWTGCLDDVMVFVRYVPNEEQAFFFQRGPTEDGDETKYDYPPT